MSLDETSTSDTGGTSPAVNESGSSPETNTSALAGATGSDVSTSTGTTSDVSTTGQETTASASEDPFAKYQVDDNANLQQIREKHRELLNDHRAFQKSTEPLNAWKPLVDQYQAPEQVQSLLTMAEGFLGSRLENGVPVPTAMPGLQMLHDQSPSTFMTVAEELANFELQGRPVFDWQLDAYLNEQGLTLDDLNHFKQLKQSGGLNVAPTGDINADDLASIPEQYRDAFKAMPPHVRADLLLSEESTRDYMLRAAKSEIDNRSWAEQQQSAHQQQMEQAQVKQRQEIVQAQETAVNDIWSSTFKSLHDEFASKGWKPSADESASSLQYGLVLAATHAATNPALAPILNPLMEAAGVKVDGQKLSGLLTEVDEATRRQVYFEKTGDPMQAKRAEADRNRAQYHVKTLANGIIAQIMGVLDGTAAEKRQAQESRLSGATSRTVLSGQAVNGNGVNPYKLPEGVKPYSPEARAFQAGLLNLPR